MTAPDWIAVDWGTTNLRIWAMHAEGNVLERRKSDHGMGRLREDQFEKSFLSLVEDLLPDRPTPVLVCGMAGARGGWREAGYVSVPAAPQNGTVSRVITNDSRIDVCILPGLSQTNPPDVMRGEETQIAGVLARNPEFDGVICLPGTHTKWVRVAGGAVLEFRTFMTGELFAILTQHSILRQSLDDDWDDATFADALAQGLAAPADTSAALFGLRAQNLLATPNRGETRARLSGLLIGLELAGARSFWEQNPVILVGEKRTRELYASLGRLAPEVRHAETEDMTLAGLIAARSALKGEDV